MLRMKVTQSGTMRLHSVYCDMCYLSVIHMPRCDPAAPLPPKMAESGTRSRSSGHLRAMRTAVCPSGHANQHLQHQSVALHPDTTKLWYQELYVHTHSCPADRAQQVQLLCCSPSPHRASLQWHTAHRHIQAAKSPHMISDT